MGSYDVLPQVYNVSDPVGLNTSAPLASGECSFDRRFIAQTPGALVSGTVGLTYFTATKTETITQLAMHSTGQAAVGTTLARYGVYSVNGNDVTLIASTPNDVALFAAGFTRYPKALSSPWNKIAGQRYAIAVLVLAATMPSMMCGNVNGATIFDTVYGLAPRISGSIVGQTDLPNTFTVFSGTRAHPFVEMIP